MNKHILHRDVQDFIDQHLKSNLTKLILKGSPFNHVSIQELATQIAAKEKSRKKLPSWFETKNIYYPPKLNLEQTSSEVTAKYKASLISGTDILDLTGGFGVDCFAFTKSFDKVIHCELEADLSKIARHNFLQLKCENIETISGDGIEYLMRGPRKFDCIYIDPSRRNDAKGKVFLLKDCTPNIPKYLTAIFHKSEQILIKTSPILDITSAIRELHSVKEVHIVAVLGEVKELLFVLQKGFSGAITLKTINLQKESVQKFDFMYHSDAVPSFDLPKKYLFEPNAAILKSGGFFHVSEGLNLDKLHPLSHLYTSDNLLEFPGRIFEIRKILKYDKKKIKSILPAKKANITTRNFPKTVAQIRRELKINDGGNDYLFFTTDINNQLICIHSTKI